MKRISKSFLMLFSISVIAVCGICSVYGYSFVHGEYSILKGEILKLEARNIERIVILKQDVLSIVDTSASYVEVIGAETGETLLKIFTKRKRGNKIFKITVTERDMDELLKDIKKVIHGQLGLRKLKIRKNKLTGKILVEGMAKKEDLDKINAVLKDFSEDVDTFVAEVESRDIVEISVEVLEVDSGSTQQLGFQWPSALTIGRDAVEIESKMEASFELSRFTRDALSATLNLLIQEGKARILSRPKLACLSGREAELLVGGEKPILTTEVSEGSSGTNVEYKEYGIKLNIAPIVNSDDTIEVNLEVEVSDVEDTALTIGSSEAPTARAYPLTKRTTSTSLLLKNEQTLSISGLMRKKSAETLQKFPWLSDIPILGSFFRYRDVKTGGGSGELANTELVIMLTPRILRSEEDKTLRRFAGQVDVPNLSRTERTEITAYMNKVRTIISASMAESAWAKEVGWQGQVTLGVELTSEGQLAAVDILKSSGHRLFDTAIVQTVKEIGYYPPFPSTLDQDKLELEVPIVYNLD